MKTLFGFCVVLLFCLQFESSFQHAMPFPCEVNVTDPILENVSTQIRFRIINVDNGLYVNDTNLLNYHARKLHVVIISDSWGTFQHFHPEEFGSLSQMSEEGYFWVETSFPKNGSYMMNVDFVVLTQYNYPVEGYCSFVINVTGSTPQVPPMMVPFITDSATMKIKGLPFQAPDKYSNLIYVDDLFTDSYSLDVTLMPMGTTFNQLWYCLMIQVTVTTPNGSLAVLSPYLNAQVHAVFVHNDSQRIWHTHSMNMSHSMMMSCDIDVSWDMLNYTEAPKFGPTITAYITPELPGLWQGFLQMKHENNMLLVPFQFEVYVTAPNTTSSTTGMSMGHMTMTMDGTSTTTTGMAVNTTELMDDHSGAVNATCTISMLFLLFIVLIC